MRPISKKRQTWRSVSSTITRGEVKSSTEPARFELTVGRRWLYTPLMGASRTNDSTRSRPFNPFTISKR